MKLKLKEIKELPGGVHTFVWQPPEPLVWEAGQFMHYLFSHPSEDNRGHERWFTISSAPYEGTIQITTRINDQKSSSFKTALMALKPGDTIEADGPKGKFVIKDPARHMLFVAGGIGVTPYHSILKQADHDGKKYKIDLLYANRDDNAVFKDEFEEYAKRNPNLKIEYFITPTKLTSEIIKQRADAIDDPYLYLSGPEPMIEQFFDELTAMGLDKENIKTDYFPGYQKEQ